MKKTLSILVLVVSLIISTGCGCQKQKQKTVNQGEPITNEDGTLKQTINTNEGVTKSQVVEGLTLTKTDLVSTAYSATLMITATNSTDKDIKLNYLKVFLKDKDGKDIIESPNYIIAPVYGTIKSGETKQLNANIDRSLKDVFALEYEMVK